MRDKSDRIPDLASRKFKFVGCEIIYREACLLAARSPNVIDVQFVRKGLHDLKTADMLGQLQSMIDAVGDGYEAILLGYARCSNGTVGLTARRTPLVIPRAHDCISFFFGGRSGYKEYFDAHPGTYFHTTGWIERGANYGGGESGVMGQLGLDRSYAELVGKYGKEDADYIIQTMGDWTANYKNLCYVQMGVCEETPFIEQSRNLAQEKGWSHEVCQGRWTLLEKLFAGRWDDDFVIVQPGQSIVARNDEWVLDKN
jgi:hypothetical protein